MPPILEAGWVSTEDQRGDPLGLIAHGPTTDVTVGWLIENEEDEAPDVEPAKALIDTGATESCIDETLAEKLGLPVVDVMPISGAGGMKNHNVYAAEVHVLSLGLRQVGRFAGVHLNAGGQHHAVLLGRTFLQNMVMIYDGRRGHVSIAY